MKSFDSFFVIILQLLIHIHFNLSYREEIIAVRKKAVKWSKKPLRISRWNIIIFLILPIIMLY